MYADYQYYWSTFCGRSVNEIDWEELAPLASDFIDYITWGKAKDNAELEAVKKCCCALVEQYNLIKATRTAASAKVTAEGIIASESVGAHSRSFRNGAEGTQAVSELEKELANIAKRYLLPTGLLYRGVNYVHATCCDAL